MPDVVSCVSLTAADRAGCTLRLEEENGLGEGKPDFLSFSPEMVAEQFTLMDAVSVEFCNLPVSLPFGAPLWTAYPTIQNNCGIT